MPKITLTDLANLTNESTATGAINSNNAAIETAIENTLSRDGTSPNQMEADLDMNGFRVLNLPQATSPLEPVRLQEVGDAPLYASQAAASAQAAASSALSAANSLDSFDDRYLGAKATDPTVDNDGDPLLDGALYWNTSLGLKIYDLGTTTWNAYTAASGLMDVSQDLSPQLGGDLDLNGHVITGMVIGTDVQAYDADTAKTDISNTFSAAQTFSAKVTANSDVVLVTALEKITRVASAATGTINFDTKSQSILHYTANASANWTLNIRGDASTTLDSLMSVGQVKTVVFKANQGVTAYYMSAVQIDGTSTGVTVQYPDGDAPVSGRPSSRDVYQLSIEKTASATFLVEVTVLSFA